MPRDDVADRARSGAEGLSRSTGSLDCTHTCPHLAPTCAHTLIHVQRKPSCLSQGWALPEGAVRESPGSSGAVLATPCSVQCGHGRARGSLSTVRRESEHPDPLLQPFSPGAHAEPHPPSPAAGPGGPGAFLSPSVWPAGQRLARRCRAEGLVAAWGCGPCPVTGRPSGTSDCSQRQNNARRAARAPRAAPQRPAREPQALFHQAGPKLCPPALCCCLPLSCLLQPGVALAAHALWHSTALLGLHRAQHQAAAPSCLPRGSSSPAARGREGGRGREGSRSDGACQVLGHGPGHGHQPCAPGGFKPLSVPREAAPTPPIHTMRLLSLLLLLGLCCLWARLVSPGECGWARVGTGGCRSQWNSAAEGCAAMGTETTVTVVGMQHPTCAVSPTSLHAAEMTTTPLTALWESCLGSLEPSLSGSHCGAARCAQSCYRVRA